MSSLTAASSEPLVAAAVLAPSSHNTQPWAFRCGGDVIELHADRTRALPVNDPFDRELTIKCGAALFNLRVVDEATGLTPSVQLLPVIGDDGLLASITFHARGSKGHGELADAIPRRRTHRGPFTGAPPPQDVVRRLEAAAAEFPVVLHWVPAGEEREVVAKLVGEGDRAQFADPSWRRELASWMRPRHRGDGLTVSGLAGPATRFVVSHFDVGARIAGKGEAVTRDAPLVGVLATDNDDTADWLATGQALEHLLLVAARAGVHAGYSNQPCQVARLRPELRDALGLTGQPQIVLRLGIAANVPPAAPRRPVHEVIDTAPR